MLPPRGLSAPPLSWPTAPTMPAPHTTIPPALTSAEWAELQAHSTDHDGDVFVHADLVLSAAAGEWHRTIALANAAVPDGDPGKLCWATIDALRARSGYETIAVDAAALRHLLGIVVAVLPPR